GRPIVLPSQDMVLGCYYLTAENPNAVLGVGRYFSSMDDVIIAYEQKVVDLHSYIWLRFDGDVEDDGKDREPQEIHRGEDGSVTELYTDRRVRKDAEGNLLSQYVRTTPGRVIYNKTIHDALVS
ncbi:DNA-directed RNA polymerase subunit gamma, partial [Leptolyngbya sp. FACHB-711]|nr:DNA-directed RNA polymerase subunit gamma [Leptolyngbya sp. FACHB-711]